MSSNLITEPYYKKKLKNTPFYGEGGSEKTDNVEMGGINEEIPLQDQWQNY